MTTEKVSGNTGFAIIRLWGVFRLSMADNSVVSRPIGSKFELVQDIMHVLITCKFKKDWINKN